jgi:tripartite-type tricarboxylate transporter receptor subunit TctC
MSQTAISRSAIVSRRRQRFGFIFTALLLAAFSALIRPASAQDPAGRWPERPVKLIVAYAPGGGVDIIARVMAQKLQAIFHQAFVVENRPGASGMIGAQTVVHAEPDGYTFLVCGPAEIALDPYLMKDVSYDPLTDLAPVSLFAWTPMVLAAHPTFEASTAADLVKLGRAQAVNFSTTGIGSPHHLTGEYINKTQSTQLVHVPYRGAAPAIADTVAGQVKLTISGMPPVLPFLQAGTLKAIAVTSRQRSKAFPNIPALAETPGFEDFDFTTWFGLLAPAATPRSIIDKLAQASAAALADEAVKSVLGTQADETVGSTPDQFRDFIRAETAKYHRIVELTGVTLK